jgi:hemoglobin-like flavoprotein
VNQSQIDHIRASYDSLGHQRSTSSVERFYTRLLGEHPTIRPVLPRDLREYTMQTSTALGIFIRSLARLETLEGSLMELGASFQRRGAQPQHYGMVRETLLRELKAALGPVWSSDLEADWTEALNTAAAVMLRGAGRARGKAA